MDAPLSCRTSAPLAGEETPPAKKRAGQAERPSYKDEAALERRPPCRPSLKTDGAAPVSPVEARKRRSESAAHLELKRLALIWAQENGYPIVALEVSLPQCRYRADLAAYRPQRGRAPGPTAIFECKQSAPDLHRDDCRSPQTLVRLESVYRRRQVLERHLRVHHPTLRTGESLFPEWDVPDFALIEHRGYRRVTRELTALQVQLRDGRKFEKLVRYACANLFFLVTPNELLREPEAPLGWGLLVEKEGALVLQRKPVWHESPETMRLRVLQKIAASGTRQLNRRLDLAPMHPATQRL